MNKEEKRKLKYAINKIKKLNVEELFLVSKYFVEAALLSIKTFGLDSPLTKRVILKYKEFKKCLDEEDFLNKFIKRNLKKIDYSECTNILEIFEDVNESTIHYYYDFLDSVIDSCNFFNPNLLVEPKKNVSLLCETPFYRILVYSLILNLDNIKDFLNYPPEFWNFLESRIKVIDGSLDSSKFFYNTLVKKDEQNFLIDLLVIVPKIVDIKTAIINVREFTIAYELYKRLNTLIYDGESYYDDEAMKNESHFCNSYLPSKIV